MTGGQSFHIAANRGAIGKVKLVRRAMYRIVLDGSGDVESGLLESEAHAACPCE
jgi:hypothetical protein